MSHTRTKLLVHCVFGTKGKRPLLTSELRGQLLRYIDGILRRIGAELVACGGTEDHIHLLINLRADISVAEAMRVVKANSSKWIHETFPDQAAFAWQDGYGAFNTSFSIAGDVTRYIQKQMEHHRRQAFEDEYKALLNKHHITYDERFLPA